MQPNDALIRPELHELREIVVFDASRFRWRRTGPFS